MNKYQGDDCIMRRMVSFFCFLASLLFFALPPQAVFGEGWGNFEPLNGPGTGQIMTSAPRPLLAAAKTKKKSSSTKKSAPSKSAARKKPRNLLDEYGETMKTPNAQKAKALLDEGLTVSDAVEETFVSIKNKIEETNFHLSYRSRVAGAVAGVAGAITGTVDFLSTALDSAGGDTRIKAAQIPDSTAKGYEAVFQALSERGAKFSQAQNFDVILSRRLPPNLFKVIVEASGKKVFTGSEVAEFMMCYRNDSLTGSAVGKLRFLVQYGARIDRSSSSDSLVSKVLNNVLPGMLSDYPLDQRGVDYLKKMLGLLEQLGVNPGPKARSFWQVMSTKTPWEILADFREDHRNEPDTLRFCREIEEFLPAPGD